MSNTQHTPGPWQVNSFDPLQICDTDGEWRGCAPIATTHGNAAEARANARLIAAAPALLAALQTARNVLAGIATGDLKTIHANSPALTQVRAAIRQATGQE